MTMHGMCCMYVFAYGIVAFPERPRLWLHATSVCTGTSIRDIQGATQQVKEANIS